ncbi:hypothetical protein [Nostoc sp.]|uniref:hypothetical protein n=1 Tax=Nostoc sp. TaxID=1180 RepID=UPI002FFD318F
MSSIYLHYICLKQCITVGTRDGNAGMELDEATLCTFTDGILNAIEILQVVA